MSATTKILSVFLLLPCVLACGVEFDVSMNALEFHAETPVTFSIRVRLNEQEKSKISSILVDERGIGVKIMSKFGQTQVMNRFVAGPSQYSRSAYWYIRATSDHSQEKNYALNKWHTTNLKSADYILEFTIENYVLIYNKGENRSSEMMSNPIKKSFSIKILEPNREALERDLQTSLEMAQELASRENLTPEESRILSTSIDRIAYTWEPAAVPFHMELLKGKIAFADELLNTEHIASIARYFTTLNDLETTKNLSEWYKSKPHFQDPFSENVVTSFVEWSMEELRKNGSFKVRQAAQSVAKHYSSDRNPFDYLKQLDQ